MDVCSFLVANLALVDGIPPLQGKEGRAIGLLACLGDRGYDAEAIHKDLLPATFFRFLRGATPNMAVD